MRHIKQVGDIEAIDPFAESVNFLVVVTFPKSSSSNFPFALSIAQLASRYAVISIAGKPMHFAAFGKDQAEAGKAAAVLKYVSGWTGTMIFAGGKIIAEHHEVAGVIDCYLKACACVDMKAHCHKIIDDPMHRGSSRARESISISLTMTKPLEIEEKIDRFAFPCVYLESWYRFQKDHESSMRDQFQAAGVNRGCHICPNFKPEDFKKIGFRTVVKPWRPS
jgi:hypothetical protein